MFARRSIAASSAAGMGQRRSFPFDVGFSDLTRDALAGQISGVAIPPGGGPRLIVTANLDHLAHLSENAPFRTCYQQAWAVTADGMPVYLYARLRGDHVPERVTGSDLVVDVFDRLDAARHRCFLIASCRATADGLARRLFRQGFQGDAVATAVPTVGFERDALASETLARAVAAHRPTHLFLGIGAPKSEVWADQHRALIGDCYVLAVGSGLDFLAGTRRRAPKWMRDAGCEWLFRFGQEPGRLFHRYFVRSWRAVGVIVRDLAS
jgi:N-acetylglucosaminyldiphosphoundecaprenol N-acetyl-beta-D-mannosaminyltransferase